jgi:hypothetical protein
LGLPLQDLQGIRQVEHKWKCSRNSQKPLKMGRFNGNHIRELCLINRVHPSDPITKKPKQRPLGIPEFDNCIVQEAIRLVLHVIYDPWLEINDNTYGFCPFSSAHDAIRNIYKKGGMPISQ